VSSLPQRSLPFLLGWPSVQSGTRSRERAEWSSDYAWVGWAMHLQSSFGVRSVVSRIFITPHIAQAVVPWPRRVRPDPVCLDVSGGASAETAVARPGHETSCLKGTSVGGAPGLVVLLETLWGA
jgi:hypothetical protein